MQGARKSPANRSNGQGRYARPIADLVAGCIGPALAAQGFAGSEIIERWDEIAGSMLARRSRPVKLVWPRRAPADGDAVRRGGAALVVLVEGAFALELQHEAPVLIERVNAYLGWGCVSAIRLKQGVVERAARVRVSAPSVDPVEEALLRDRLGGFDDEALAGALLRLGSAVAVRRRALEIGP